MSGKLRKEFIELLEKDVEFRYTVAGYLGLSEVLKRMDKMEERMLALEERMLVLEERMLKLEENQNKLWEEVKSLREGQNKLWEEVGKLREDMNRGFDLIERRLSALGARWGIMTEEAFREGIRGLLGRELGVRVERWSHLDAKGVVYGYPSNVEVDVSIHDGKTILIEVSSHVRRADVSTFMRKSKLYEEVTGKRPDRLLIVTPYIEEEAYRLAKELEIEVYTKV